MQAKRSENQSQGSKKLYTGIFLANVAAINPDKEQLCKLLGVGEDVIEKEPKYDGEKDGNDYVEIAWWLEADTALKQKFNIRHRITDKEMKSEKSGKYQYVNQSGGSSWVDDESNLQSWFTQFQDKDKNKIADRTFRIACQGEADLYDYLRSLCSHADWFSPDNSMLVDKKKLFRDVNKYVKDEYSSELKKDKEEALIDSIVCLATVYVGDKDGQKVEYQNVYRQVLPGYLMKYINNAMQTGDWSHKAIKRWKDQLEGEYGCRENYTLTPLKEYVESEWLNSTNAAIKHDDSSPINDTDY